jgi:hypothetical protein
MNWICAYTNDKGGLAIARFKTKEEAVKFSKEVNGIVDFDTWGI